MKTKIFKLISIFSFLLILCVGIKIGYATEDPITMSVSPEGAGIISLENPEIHENDDVRFRVTANKGYYLTGLTITDADSQNVTFKNDNGGANEDTLYVDSYHDSYHFTIGDKNVTITATFERRETVGISFYAFSSKDIMEVSDRASILESATFTPLAMNYVDGDIVLPDACFTENKGCVLDIEFNVVDYDTMHERFAANNDLLPEWERRDMVNVNAQRNEDGSDNATSSCPPDANDAACQATFTKEVGVNAERETGTVHRYVYFSPTFDNITNSTLNFGEKQNYIYSSKYLGFGVDSSIRNFGDMLFESGANNMAFTEANDYTRTIDVFYGENKLTLAANNINDIMCNDGGTYKTGATNCEANSLYYTYEGVTRKSGNFTLSGNDILFDSFYEINVPVKLTLNLTNPSGEAETKDVTINLNRQAFGGNAGMLNDRIENDEVVDYYFTIYRGVTNVFYSDYTDSCNPINSDIDVVTIRDNHGSLETMQSTIHNSSELCLVNRNTSFTPYAQAIYYNADGLIVGTKSIDLNTEVKIEGYSTTPYNSITSDLYYYGLGAEIAIKNINYFSTNQHDPHTINERIKVITKADVTNLGVKKVALFLTNGPLTSTGDLPELTYGVGTGMLFDVNEESGH